MHCKCFLGNLLVINVYCTEKFYRELDVFILHVLRNL